jgi:hypothetical protein
MAFLRLAGPPADARRWIKKLGLQIADSSGNFLDFADVIEQLQGKIAKYGNVRRLQIMKELFGVRAQNAMNILVREGADKLKTYRKSLDASGGAGQRMAKIMRDSIIARILQLKSNLTELGFKFIEVFAEKGGKGIDRLTKAVRNFDPKPLIQDLKKIFHVIKDDIIPILPAVAIGFVALEASLKAVTAVAAAKFFFDLAKAIGALGVGTTAGVIASMAFLSFVVFGLVAALGIVIWKYDELVAEFEIGMTHMRLWLLEFTVFFRNAFETVFNWFVNKINWVIKTLFPLLSYFEIELPTIDMSVGTEQARKEIEETKKLLNSLREEASGQDAQRGMAGARGFRRDPTVVAAELAAEQSRIQGLLGMSFSDPDKANKALAGYAANAKALSEFAGAPGAGRYKAQNLDNPDFLSTIDRWKSPLSQQPEKGQLEIHVSTDPGVAAEWKYKGSGGAQQGKNRKARKLKLPELGSNR